MSPGPLSKIQASMSLISLISSSEAAGRSVNSRALKLIFAPSAPVTGSRSLKLLVTNLVAVITEAQLIRLLYKVWK